MGFFDDYYYLLCYDGSEWKKINNGFEDVLGLCKSASLAEIKENNYSLTPGRYVGIEDVRVDIEIFDKKMKLLIIELAKQKEKSKKLDEEIKKNLGSIGYEF